MTTALITGVAGQDGVLLARRLLRDNVRVVGTVRPGGGAAMAPYLDGVEIVPIDLRTPDRLERIAADVAPDEVYHLAAVSTVGGGKADPEAAAEVNVGVAQRLLDSTVDGRVFLASSSEVFGPDAPNPQTEATPLRPAHPYAASKARLHELAAEARGEGRFVSVGILYNHESTIRRPTFVTRKVTRAAAAIAAGRETTLSLGNLHTSRDWSSAVDVVDAMARMLRVDEPEDLVLASGVLHSIRDLVETAFAAAGVDDPWQHVTQDPDLVRRADTPGLCGDATRAHDVLGWAATRSFGDLVQAMVDADGRRLATGIEEHPSYLVG